MESVDILGAKHVEIRVRHDGTVLWVNVDGLCRLRVCRIRGEIKVEGLLAKTGRRTPEPEPIAEPHEAQERDYADQAIKVSKAIRPHLSGLPHQVVGAVLADLLATLVRGFQPASVRDAILAMHFNGVIAVIEAMDKNDQSPKPGRHRH